MDDQNRDIQKHQGDDRQVPPPDQPEPDAGKTREGGAGMREFLQYHRRMLTVMIGVSLLGTVVLLVAMRQETAWGWGFAVGAAAQLFKFAFLDVGVVRRIAAGRDPASTQLRTMFLTLVVFGLAVAVVFKLRLNVWAMAAGIFLPRLLLMADVYVRPNLFAASDKDPDGK